ncbi:MAG: M23 family metallopeptidase [Candidatus Zixiibacteriota bacterium]
MPGGQQVTLMLIFGTGKTPVTLKFSRLIYYVVIGGVGLLVLVSIVGTFTYARLLVHSSERDQLVRENEELRRLNSKIVLLESNLQAYRSMLNQVATLAGIDLSQYGMQVPQTIEDSAVSPGTQEPSLITDQANTATGPVSIPRGLPVQGFVSRTFRPTADNPKTRHLGVDIAVKKGTRVLATADGEVFFAGWDEAFGWKVVLKHPNNVETMYGHNDTLLVATGQSVRYGQVIALSGTTGVSTAPHVHYEVRVDGQPVSPGEYDGKDNNSESH